MHRANLEIDAARNAADRAIRIVREAADEVVGETDIRHVVSAGGGIRAGYLADLAEEVIARGAALHGPGAGSLAAIETRTTLLNPCRDDILVVRAVPLHVGTGLMVWQAMIGSREGEPLAIVQQTYAPAARSAQVSTPAIPPQPASPSATAVARIDAILAAGSRVIAARGFANATTKEIAAAAGMTAPTMYQYVRSKDELLFLICDSCFRDLSERVDEAAAQQTPPADRLRAAMEAVIDASEPRRAEVRLLSRESASLPPALRAKVHRRWNEFLARFSSIVEEGIASGAFRSVEPDLASHLIEALCDIWALRRVALRRHGFEKSKAEIVELVLHGLAQEPDRLAPPAGR